VSEQTDQNFQNHSTFDKKFFIVALLGLATVILGLAALFFDNTRIGAAGLVTAGLGIMGGIVTVRLYSTKLQDRIIRTEMRLRLHTILDLDLAAKSDGLSISQLVALRFASDAELPALVEKVLNENLTSSNEIKKLVSDWQGDYYRV
jgi:hypothetical protein